ncbi:MAG: amidohydrolase, partial [Tenacibaculum sp.]|nr:amidohydrolase [Tenacibaculum sp.]
MKRFSIFSLIIATLLLIGCSTKKEPVDLVLKNGNIYTENDKSPKAEAVAVKDGKIVFVGTNKEIENYIGEQTKVTDLQGKTVLPSFIDSHTHPGL